MGTGICRLRHLNSNPFVSNQRLLYILLLALIAAGPILIFTAQYSIVCPDNRPCELTVVGKVLSSLYTAPLQRRLPHFIIVGTKKSGTRALLKFIGSHPDVVTATNEIHFFDREENYARGLAWYREQMPPSGESQLVGEKSPGYFISSDAPLRIKLMNESVRLIVVVRDPIDRAVSNYLQFKVRRDDMVSFEESVSNNDGDIRVQGNPIVKNSMYSEFLQNWLAQFPLAQMHFVDGNLLLTQPAKEVRKVEQFLDIRRWSSENHFGRNEKGFFCLLGNAHEKLCLGSSKGRPHPTVSQVINDNLKRFYKPFNQKLGTMTGLNFSWFTNYS